MARGGARVGAGRPRRPIAEHLARGTFRPYRHGPRPAANVLPMLPAPSKDWTPTPDDLAGLGDAGRALVARILAHYDPTTVEGLQLLEAARAADVLAALRAVEAPDLRQVRLWSTYYTGLIRGLGLTR